MAQITQNDATRLVLQIVSHQRKALGARSCKVFDQRGGSLGRGRDNDWVLPDEERYLSSRHAVISHRNGRYYLEDISTNGVFVNDSSQMVGRGNPVALNDGDRLRFGEYEVQVGIDRRTQSDILPNSGVRPMLDSSDEADPLKALDLALSASPSSTAEEADPLQAFDLAGSPSQATNDDPFAVSAGQAGAQADHVPAEHQYFKPPEPAVGLIPDNWDETGFKQGAPPASAHPQRSQERSASISEVSNLQRDLAVSVSIHDHGAQSSSRTIPPAERYTHQSFEPATSRAQGDAGLHALLRGAGLSESLPSEGDGLDSLMRHGTIFREMVKGLMDVLMARTKVKSAFRMPVTTIKPVENNPLKFAISVDEVLRCLLAPQGSGYLPAVAAFREGFQDLKDHQLAMMAGLQAALHALLAHFDPKNLEAAFSKKMGRLRRRKSAYWDCYTEFYRKTSQDAVDDNFQSILGEAFASAYEEQIRRLEQERASPPGGP